MRYFSLFLAIVIVIGGLLPASIEAVIITCDADRGKKVAGEMTARRAYTHNISCILSNTIMIGVATRCNDAYIKEERYENMNFHARGGRQFLQLKGMINYERDIHIWRTQ